FALMGGDQVYADDIEEAALKEADPRRRIELYLSIYRKSWSNLHYRRILCALPAVLMWDDHDITDGAGSREDSFPDEKATTFHSEGWGLFGAAGPSFGHMRASRNPPPLSPGFEGGFDTCFRVGRAGFAVADLRSGRNVRKSRMWDPSQLASIRAW